MYIKRQTIQKFWAIPRKGTKYLAKPSHERTNAMPLIVVMRDILKLVDNKKELKKLINNKEILINGSVIREPNYPILLFDSISLPTIKKHYKTIFEGKKLGLKEVGEKEASKRIYKIVNKRTLKNKKIQVNLSNGKNILLSKEGEKIKVGEFIILENKTNKIIQIIPLKKEVDVIVIKGKHIGVQGKIKNIIQEEGNEGAEITVPDREDIIIDIHNLFVVE